MTQQPTALCSPDEHGQTGSYIMDITGVAVTLRRWCLHPVNSPRFVLCKELEFLSSAHLLWMQSKAYNGVRITRSFVKRHAQEAKGQVLIPLLIDCVYMEINYCGALSTISHTRASPFHCPVRIKKCLVRGQMESLQQDEELNSLPSIKCWMAFPFAMGSFFYGQSYSFKWIF